MVRARRRTVGFRTYGSKWEPPWFQAVITVFSNVFSEQFFTEPGAVEYDLDTVPGAIDVENAEAGEIQHRTIQIPGGVT